MRIETSTKSLFGASTPNPKPPKRKSHMKSPWKIRCAGGVSIRSRLRLWTLIAVKFVKARNRRSSMTCLKCLCHQLSATWKTSLKSWMIINALQKSFGKRFSRYAKRSQENKPPKTASSQCNLLMSSKPMIDPSSTIPKDILCSRSAPSTAR